MCVCVCHARVYITACVHNIPNIDICVHESYMYGMREQWPTKSVGYEPFWWDVVRVFDILPSRGKYYRSLKYRDTSRTPE